MLVMNEEGDSNVDRCMPSMITWEPSSSLHSLTLYDDHGDSLAGGDDGDTDDYSVDQQTGRFNDACH